MRFCLAFSRLTAGFLCGVTVLFFAPHARSAPVEASALPEITVTASAEPETLKNTPANVQVISPAEIARTGATNLIQLLERSSAVGVLAQPGNYSRVTLRGFSTGKSVGNTFSDQVLLLIDGNRAGTGNVNNIPLASIERVEILRGPASVLYGGSAVGGVINVITKRGKGPVQARIGAEGGSFDRYAAHAGVSGGLADDSLGFSAAMQTEHSGDYDTGRGHRYKNSEYSKSGGGASLTWRPHDAASISGVFAMQEVYDAGSPGDIYWPTPNSRTSNSWYYGALELETRLDNDVSIKASLYTNKNTYEDDNREDFPYSSRYTANMYGARSVVGLPLPRVGDFDLGRLAIGAEYALHTLKLGGTSISEPDSETDVYSLFAEHKFSPLSSVNVQYGVRYDLYDARTKESNKILMKAGSEQFEQFTWSGGATWWMLDWLGLRGSVGTAYVPPSSMQLLGEYTSWGVTYRGNPNLKAEKSLTWDIGLEVEKYGLSASLGYFETRYKDRIATSEVLSVPSRVVEYVNQSRQEVSGLEGSLRYAADFALGDHTFTVVPYSNWEYLTKRTNSGANRITKTITDLPRYTGLVGLELGLDNVPVLGALGLDVNAQFIGNHVGYDFSSYRYREFSSFALLNARLTATPADNLSVFLDVRNLEDKYYGYKPEFPLEGRTFTLGVRYEY